MCGIVGFNWKDKDKIRQLADLLSHRGPEQQGYHVADGVSLGHKRLCILDLSEKGTQPIYNEDGSVCIVYNGETYNFADLRSQLETLGQQFAADQQRLADQIYKLAGREFNANSPQQLGQVLFEELGLPKGRRTKSGWSTSAEVLDQLAPDYEIVRLVLEYRQFAKLYSTYVKGLLEQIDPHTGRVHTTFEQTSSSP